MREIDNAVLMHGGTEDIDIPYPSLKSLVQDALKPDCDEMNSKLLRQNEQLLAQVEALEDANKRVCDERDTYKSLCHQLEARLAGRVYE